MLPVFLISTSLAEGNCVGLPSMFSTAAGSVVGCVVAVAIGAAAAGGAEVEPPRSQPANWAAMISTAAAQMRLVRIPRLHRSPPDELPPGPSIPYHFDSTVVSDAKIA